MALTKHARLTVADLRKLKGKRQLTMLFVETPEEAARRPQPALIFCRSLNTCGRPRCARRRVIASFRSG